jgi:hypothetical protein
MVTIRLLGRPRIEDDGRLLDGSQAVVEKA